MWDETEGGKRPQDLSSCLVKHLKAHAKHCKHMIMYSDSFTGQNLCGHSYLLNDADFGLIEAESRKQHTIIYQIIG
ncbi:hypothetical protein PR048_010887 [Dryococelus australis]|uniref:Uncharacterized protein n=1 Tax=Dryococelus australis TaxID=614101 RepID=A0ABQ9I3Y1_9NEOP|nr:hypothetical protein PR048_010887 [Dryococelus australis]